MSPIKQLLVTLTTTAVFLSVLLISAGRLDYWQAWLYAGISLVMDLASRLVLRGNPELARERSRPGAGGQGWDKRLLGLGLLVTLAMLVVAGLDSGRHHWSPRLSWPWVLPGIALTLAGMTLFLRSMAENRFFSAVVRIQADRGHTVCTTGPYAVIRHPGSAGMILGTLGFPFLFTSAWTAIPALISVAIMVRRTALEDAFLARELGGYGGYLRGTPYRLIPGVW